jgi:hypothetical protein
VIGLGTGRAASAFVRSLGVEARAGRQVRGVPTSEASAALARASGIRLAGLDEPSIDVTVDGADEVDPDLDMIKGYGGRPRPGAHRGRGLATTAHSWSAARSSSPCSGAAGGCPSKWCRSPCHS